MKEIVLKNFAEGGRLLGTRQIAFPIRDKVESALAEGEQIALDFGGTNPTQSFIDELVGVLVLEHGSEVLENLLMRNCSEDTQAILHFVVSDRLEQMAERTLDAYQYH